LIESPLPQSPDVQGHGDHHIDRVFSGKGLKGGLHEVAKNPYQGKDTLVFKLMDRLLERPLIEATAAMDLEIPLLFQTRAAKITPSISGGYG